MAPRKPTAPLRRPNQPPARTTRKSTPINAPRPAIHQVAAQVARGRQRACPNKECEDPDVQEDGLCHNCGTIVDDSNIVSEVTFGETGTGAAVVQGTYMADGQGIASGMGPAFNRVGRGGNQLNSIKDARTMMDNWRIQLKIPPSVVDRGHQLYKLASNANFVQGRRIDQVAAVCLYSAHRQHENGCNTMLIDYADKLGVNVFKLGTTFKALHETITASKDGIRPVIAEDLMHRFADKLDFGDKRDIVAADAIRLAQRMSKDWIAEGRRPSGICGAALVMAASMNHFRRTIVEVVYIVKVTTHTIQKRMDEFRVTPSAALTIDDFLHNEFLEQAHDPPSFYEKQPGYVSNKRKRKRKGKFVDIENSESTDGANKRQKNGDAIATQIRRDADGFAIPAQPPQSQSEPQIDPVTGREIPPPLQEYGGRSAVIGEANENIDEDEHLGSVYNDFGDQPAGDDGDEDGQLAGASISRGPDRRYRSIVVPDAWAAAEDELEIEITEMVSDPRSREHAILYARAEKRTELIMQLLAEQNAGKVPVSMDKHIGEDEFVDDDDVMNCLLSPEQVAMKEKLWVNDNKSWLRIQQTKMFEKKKAENGPPKARRNRQKKPRIGEGVEEAATAEEAVVKAISNRPFFSRKVNADALASGLFDTTGVPQGRFLGSRQTSAAPSTTASTAASESDEEESEDEEDSESGSPVRASDSQAKSSEAAAVTRQAREDSVASNPDDYVNPDDEAEDDEPPEDDDEDDDQFGEEEPDEFDEMARYQAPRRSGCDVGYDDDE